MEYKNIYIAVCDILGFKDLVMKNDFESTKNIFDEFVTCIELSVANGNSIQYDFKGRKVVGADSDKIRLNFNIFSDTVVIWTNDNSFYSFSDLLNCTASLFCNSLKLGLPLRGAISHGELQVNPYKIDSQFLNIENIMFGKALINGYDLEQIQKWSGCIIDPMLEFEGDIYVNEIFKEKFRKNIHPMYLFYDVPIKQNNFKNYLTLNWLNWNDSIGFNEDDIIQSFAKYNKDSSSEEVQLKLKNTIDFFKYSLTMKNKFNSIVNK